MGLKNCRENKKVGDNDRKTEGEGQRQKKCTGGLDWKRVREVWGRGVTYPAFSVDVAALCGPPHTDTPANESDLVSTSQKNSVSMSLCSPEQSTPPLIF